MSKKFIRLIKELNYTIVYEELFVKFLYAIIVYLSCLFIFLMFKIDELYAFFIAGAYLLFNVILETRKDKVKEVESMYPNLNEQIRTARDNLNIDNPVVEALQQDIRYKVKYVRASTFFPIKKVAVSLIIIILLAFATTTLISKSIYTEDFFKEKLPGYFSFLGTPVNGSSNVSVELNITEDIYGDIETMELGSKELNIKLMPSSYEVSVREEGEFSEKSFDLTYATEITADSGKAYEENIPKEQQDIVKNYFIKLAES